MKQSNSTKSYVEILKEALDSKDKFINKRQSLLGGLRKGSVSFTGRKAGKSIFDEIDMPSKSQHKILVNEADLEKYPALKDAYENFRMIEKMCIGGKRLE